MGKIDNKVSPAVCTVNKNVKHGIEILEEINSTIFVEIYLYNCYTNFTIVLCSEYFIVCIKWGMGQLTAEAVLLLCQVA